jgi:hypothetical protein
MYFSKNEAKKKLLIFEGMGCQILSCQKIHKSPQAKPFSGNLQDNITSRLRQVVCNSVKDWMIKSHP